MAKLGAKHKGKVVLVYGPPKSGKTELVGKLAEKYKLLWMDLENGSETLLKMPQAWQDNIELIDLPDTKRYPIAIETMLKAVRGKVSICDQHGKVACPVCKKAEATSVTIDLPKLNDPNTILVVDSLSQLVTSAMSQITRNEPDDYKLSFNDYGNLARLMDAVLSEFQQANYNVICISHEVDAAKDEKKVQLVPNGGTRNYSSTVAKFFGHVIYCYRQNMKHKAASSTGYSNKVLTGSRTDVDLSKESELSLLPIFEGKVTGNGVATPAKLATSTLGKLNSLKKGK